MDLMDRGVAHEGTGGDQLVLLIHVALANALAHVLTAQLVDCCSGVRGVRIPKWQYKLLLEYIKKKTKKSKHRSLLQLFPDVHRLTYHSFLHQQ